MDLVGKEFLVGVFRAAVAAVEPGALVRRALRRSPEGLTLSAAGEPSAIAWADVRNLFLVGGGKAGRRMGEAAVEILGERVAAGVIAVPRGSGGTAASVRFVEGGHPLPDEGSREAARDMLSLLSGAGEKDLAIALISGGASAMISAPAEGVSPEDKEAVLRLLLRSGAGIAELNTVRKHLSRVKGGRLANAAHPARLWALLLSDVPGDDPSVIASGPLAPDPTTYADARGILLHREIWAQMPVAAREYIEEGAAGRVPETPKPGDAVFARVASAVVGSNRDALEAAAEAAKRGGAAAADVLPGFLEGEARECARLFVSRLRAAAASLPPGRVAVLAAGGETTVAVRGRGCGGRSQEFALAAALELDAEEGIAVLCAGTDGVDGPTDAAGAYARGDTCARGRSLGLDPLDHLARNDSHPFFRALSDLVVAGPTGTNVADVAIGAAAGGGARRPDRR